MVFPPVLEMVTLALACLHLCLEERSGGPNDKVWALDSFFRIHGIHDRAQHDTSGDREIWNRLVIRFSILLIVLDWLRSEVLLFDCFIGAGLALNDERLARVRPRKELGLVKRRRRFIFFLLVLVDLFLLRIILSPSRIGLAIYSNKNGLEAQDFSYKKGYSSPKIRHNYSCPIRLEIDGTIKKCIRFLRRKS